MSKEQLRLPASAVTHKPQFNTLPVTVIFPNRTRLLQVHNMALNRAFFFSYIWQNFNQSKNDAVHLPGLFYLYMSAVADVTGNPNIINGSTLLYDIHKFYPNWFNSLEFNKTLNLFGVRAIRFDPTFHPINFLREPGLNVIKVFDMGALQGDNFTHSGYKNAPWYGRGPNDPGYIPEPKDRLTQGNKEHLHNFEIRWTNAEKVKKNFFGPPYGGQLETEDLPVKFTQPWFECGKRDEAFNEWLVSSVSPVIDIMPRYGLQKNMMKPTSVAVTAMDTFFINIPINLCPISIGNPAPNIMAGSDMCKSPSTVCEPIFKVKRGVNFSSSRYQCRCAAGYRYPLLRSTPYQGSRIRKSTSDEYEQGFECLPIGNLMLWPGESGVTYHGGKNGGINFARKRRSAEDLADEEEKEHAHQLDALIKADAKEEEEEVETVTVKDPTEYADVVLNNFKITSEPPEDRNKDMKEEVHRLVSRFSKAPESTTPAAAKLQARYRRSTPFMQEVTFNNARYMEMKTVFKKLVTIGAKNCHRFPLSDLKMPGTASYGAAQQFEGEAATALRLAHFLSAFLQLNQPNYAVAAIRLGQILHEEHVIGEALANVAGNTRIVSSGVFFDRNTFVDSKNNRRQFFGPLVYRPQSMAEESFVAKDMTNFGGYANQSWFSELKERWGANAHNLQKFFVLASIRGEPYSDKAIPHPDHPMNFWAAKIEDGFWTQPYFDCSGPVKQWLLTYAVPFFGRTQENKKLQFNGVVTVSVKLEGLNINQCPGKYYEANFFQGTCLCDQATTYCLPTHIDSFKSGGYECHCRRGFEFPFGGERYFYLGATMEKEYEKMQRGEPNIFPMLKCRESAASRMAPFFSLVLGLSLAFLLS